MKPSSLAKKKNGRIKLLFAVGLFAAAAIVSTAYALGSGTITMRGVVARTQNIDVRFTNAVFVGGSRTGEHVTISADHDYKKFFISAQLLMPGDFRDVSFQVQNTGNQAVRLLNVQTASDDSASTGLLVLWPDENPSSPNITNYLLMPGAVSDTFLLRVGWDPAAVDVPTGLFRSFSLILDYQNALLPMD